MAIKTILVHLAADPDHVERLKVAMEIARRNNAHVSALFGVKPVGMPAEIAGRSASSAYLASTVEEARKRAAELEEEFRGACGRDGISHTWIVEEGDHLELLEQHVHLADLAIVTQVEHKYIDEVLYPPLPDKLITRAGCGVLVLPNGWQHDSFGRHALIAWKSSRECARAVRDALPLLHDAERVTVLGVGPKESGSLPIEEAQGFLARHGIESDRRTDFHDSSHIGEIILDHAGDLACDLIVMGAYGRSRITEFLTGGTTRHVLGHMKVPAIMSH